MTLFRKKIPFGLKIYSIAISILGLLIILSWFTYDRVAAVGNNLLEITEVFMPLEELVTNIDVHTLEQEIHLERIWRKFEIKPVDMRKIHKEKELFEERGLLVDKEIVIAEKLIKEALERVDIKEEILELVHVLSILEDIEQEHQEYHDHGIKILDFLLSGELVKAHILQEELEAEKKGLANEMEALLLEIQRFTEKRVHFAAQQEKDVLYFNAILVAISLVIGITYASMVTLGLMKPVHRLVNGTKELRSGNLSVNIPVTTKDEIGEMTTFFNAMVQEIRDKEHIKTTFGQFLDPRIVDELITRSGDSMDKGEKRNMTVFFSDVAGFSSISEQLTAGGLVNLINSYLTLASEPITRHHGVIDKYIGDAVVAFWGEPFAYGDEHARLACDAALEQFIQLEKLYRMLPDLLGIRKGLPSFTIRIGLATGPLIAGNIGSQELQSYTVLGNAVKYAETLETANKMFGTKILISQDTFDIVKNDFETRKICKYKTSSSSSNQSIYELISRKGECDPDTKIFRDLYEDGLKLFQKKQYQKAYQTLQNCLKLKKGDKPTLLHLKRISDLASNKEDL